MSEFETEVCLLDYLQGHPNIVALQGAGRTQTSNFYIQLEFGKCLFDMSKVVGAMGDSIGYLFGSQILFALHYLHHEKGVAHCDLKLENLLVNPKAEIKLADFGQSILYQREGN